MRFAVISDVQANVSALAAVLESIDSYERRLDRVICLGDSVGRGPNPNEVVALLRERGVAAVRGNYDDAVAFDRIGSGVDFASNEAEDVDRAALEWTRRTLTGENVAYLQSLPRDLRLFPTPSGMTVKEDMDDPRISSQKRGFLMRWMFGGLAARPSREPGKRVLVMHGSPRALNEAIRDDTAKSILATIAREAQTDVLITGHAGMSFERESDGVTFIGVGSVSGDNATPGQAEYAIVEIGTEIKVEFGRTGYDVTEQVRAIAAEGLPSQLADPYRLRPV